MKKNVLCLSNDMQYMIPKIYYCILEYIMIGKCN